MPTSEPSVCAVVVTYRPDPAVLQELVARVQPQVAQLVVVANAAAGGAGSAGLPGGVQVLSQPLNLGLAAAQNLGIGWARGQGHTHVLLLDQDSLPAPGMVAALLGGLTELTGPDASPRQRVAAVGPRFRDERDGAGDLDAPFIRVGFPMSHKLWCRDSCRHISCDFLISSGALIPLAVLDEIGEMNAALFIDNVDMEWSFRARARGYALYGICAATMAHRLGDDRRAALFGRVEITTHAPVRLYYIMRNRVALYRLPHTPRVWIAQDLPRVLVKFCFFAFLVGPRPTNVRCMLTGLLHGLRGRLGPSPAWMVAP